MFSIQACLETEISERTKKDFARFLEHFFGSSYKWVGNMNTFIMPMYISTVTKDDITSILSNTCTKILLKV